MTFHSETKPSTHFEYFTIWCYSNLGRPGSSYFQSSEPNKEWGLLHGSQWYLLVSPQLDMISRRHLEGYCSKAITLFLAPNVMWILWSVVVATRLCPTEPNLPKVVIFWIVALLKPLSWEHACLPRRGQRNNGRDLCSGDRTSWAGPAEHDVKVDDEVGWHSTTAGTNTLCTYMDEVLLLWLVFFPNDYRTKLGLLHIPTKKQSKMYLLPISYSLWIYCI
jgi:hypothetical protein